MEELLGEISQNIKSKLARPLAPMIYSLRPNEQSLSDRIREQSERYKSIINKFRKFDNKVKYWRFIDDRPWRKEINNKIR